ncbi:UNVERIFIED_CONTAM: hypothetical protein FKN15_009602 [Acipenser sinensis]
MRWKLLSVSLLLSLLSSPLSSACYFCLIEKNLTDTLCTGYKLPEPSVQSYEECFNSVRRVFLDDRSVAAAGRVGRGYEEQLKTILNRLIAEVISVTRGVVSTGTHISLRQQPTSSNPKLGNSPEVKPCSRFLTLAFFYEVARFLGSLLFTLRARGAATSELQRRRTTQLWGSLQASPQVPGQTTGVAGARGTTRHVCRPSEKPHSPNNVKLFVLDGRAVERYTATLRL